MEKEKWIDEILQSAKQINSVESNPYLLTRIESRLQQKVAVGKMRLGYVVTAFAILLAIFMINVSVWRTAVNSKQNRPIQNLIQEYGWSNTDFYSSTNRN